MSRKSTSEEQLRAALGAIARDEIGSVLREARAGARERARRALEQGLFEALLAAAAGKEEAVAHGCEPAPLTGTRQMWWAYCVMRACDTAGLPAMAGVEADTKVETVAAGELAVLVSPVPSELYGDEALRIQLEDLAWLERTARAHEAVIEQTLLHTTVIPLRLCTLYRDAGGARRMLRQHRGALMAAISRVEGCLEWGVQIFIGERPREEPATEQATGTAYLAARQRRQDAARDAARARQHRLEEIHGSLGAIVPAATVNPPQRRELHHRDADMILNAAYLVERDHTEAFRAAVEGIREKAAGDGLLVELTGPWPPYNFVAEAAEVIA